MKIFFPTALVGCALWLKRHSIALWLGGGFAGMVYDLVDEGRVDEAVTVEEIVLNPIQRFLGTHVSSYARSQAN